MTTRRKLRGVIATLIAAFGVLLAVAGPASAATGAGGLTILYASSGDMAHKCNVIGGANLKYEAVVCADLITSESGADYHVKAQAEIICQVTATGQEVACLNSVTQLQLETGSGGATTLGGNGCGNGYAPCPVGRFEVQTRNWDYTIAGGEGGVCSSNVDTAYQVYTVVWGGLTSVTTPDGHSYSLGNGNANDGANESTGHYFVCP
ncbi:MAG TPA: hypothetical protein VMG38_08100 [Trebonia sp.]|nr:hypothetical protein [Trebonia sp.]